MSNSSNYIISETTITNNNISNENQLSSSSEVVSDIRFDSHNLILNRASLVGGDQFVFDGEVVSGIEITSGTQTVYGGLAESITIINGSQIVQGGEATNITVSEGTQIIFSGTVSNVSMVRDEYISNSNLSQCISGGNVFNTQFICIDRVGVNFGGEQKVFAGNVVDTDFNLARGSQSIYGGNVSNTKFFDSGHQNIYGGTVIGTSMVKFQSIYGGTVTDTYIANGSQTVSGGTVIGTSVGGTGYQSIYGGTVIATSIFTGIQSIYEGTVTDTYIRNGLQNIYGGIVSNTSIANILSLQNVVQNIYGGSAFDTNIISGTQQISGGYATNNTIINGFQVIYSGGTVTGTYIGNGEQDISGGTVISTAISSGSQDISGGTVITTTISSGSQNIYGGIVSNTNFIYSGHQNIIAGSVFNTNFNQGQQIVSGGQVSNTNFIYSGHQNIIAGSVFSTNFNQGQQIVSGGTVISTTITSGSQDISGGTVISTTITSGSQNIYGGDGIIVSNTNFIGSGYQNIISGKVLSTNLNQGQQIVSGGFVMVNAITSGSQYVSGGAVVLTTITSGSQDIYGGSVLDTVITSGSQDIYGGIVSNTSVTDGMQNIFGGYVSKNTIINGSQVIHSGGNVNQTIITSGAQIINSGAFVDNISILNGAIQSINSGAIVSHTTLLGSRNVAGIGYTTSQLIFSGGVASSTSINGGYQRIYSGAVANDTTVNDGTVYALDGAIVGNLTLNNGGFLDVFTDTIIQGVVTLNQGGSAQITTSNGGAINLVGDTNGGLTIIGDPAMLNGNVNVTTKIQDFSGVSADSSDAISLQYDGFKTGKLSGVTFPDNDHITIAMDTGFSLTLNIIGIKQTGYSLKSDDGGLGLVLTVCFLAGTEIKTKTGVTTIENLQVDDFVTTYDWAKQEYIERKVTWVGQKYCRVKKHLPDDMAGYPVRILKGAIAENVPYKDLLITSEHCLFFQDKFIPARMLVNGSSIFYDYSITSYEYYHMELEEHSVIIADGMLTESYLDTGNRHAFNHHHKIIETSLQSAKDWVKDAAAPLVVAREVVEPLYNELTMRAQKLKVTSQTSRFRFIEDSDLHLITDKGQVIRQKHVSGDHVIFMLPSDTQFIWVKSRNSRICDIVGPYIDNRHLFGVLIEEIKIYAEHEIELLEIHNEQEDLEGWYARQIQPGRWTNGKALLPIKSQNLSGNSVLYLSLQILAGGPYLEIITEEKEKDILAG